MNDKEKMICRAWKELVDNGALFEAVINQLGSIENFDEQVEMAREVVKELGNRVMKGKNPSLFELSTDIEVVKMGLQTGKDKEEE